MSDSNTLNNEAESILRDTLEKDLANWEVRKKLALLLYNQGKTKQAAEVVWDAPEIPTVDIELGFAIKVLAKGAPRKAIRLLSSIQENNKGKAVQNLGLANALMHYGMVMEAARFYGAAVAESSDLASADIEHFLLWTDDREKIWGDFNDKKPQLGELPWMKRDAKEAAELEKTMLGHTTPIKIPALKAVALEKPDHEMYVQSSQKGVEATPPPAVTIPMDRVNPKDVVIDSQLGAVQRTAAAAPATQPGATTVPAAAPVMTKPKAVPVPQLIKPGLPTAKPMMPSTSGPKPNVALPKPKQVIKKAE